MTDEDLWAHVWVERSAMDLFNARRGTEATRYGPTVRAMKLSNKDYKLRYQRFAASSTMQEPPSSHRIFDGYLVVRRLGTPREYETWMPDHAFDELYCDGQKA